MRLIDADALIDNLNGMMAVSPTGYIHGDTVEDMISDAPTIETEPHWIPCSERLPEYGEGVLTIDRDDTYSVNHIIDEETGEWFYDGVIAWMPLPVPYREGEA